MDSLGTGDWCLDSSSSTSFSPSCTNLQGGSISEGSQSRVPTGRLNTRNVLNSARTSFIQWTRSSSAAHMSSMLMASKTFGVYLAPDRCHTKPTNPTGTVFCAVKSFCVLDISCADISHVSELICYMNQYNPPMLNSNTFSVLTRVITASEEIISRHDPAPPGFSSKRLENSESERKYSW